MTDREKLGVLIQKSFDDQYTKRNLLTAYHTAEDLISNGVTVQEWISVEDELPKKWRYVFALNEYDEGEREPCIAYIDDKRWVAGGTIGCKITHWMPLPEPPKEE